MWLQMSLRQLNTLSLSHWSSLTILMRLCYKQIPQFPNATSLSTHTVDNSVLRKVNQEKSVFRPKADCKCQLHCKEDTHKTETVPSSHCFARLQLPYWNNCFYFVLLRYWTKSSRIDTAIPICIESEELKFSNAATIHVIKYMNIWFNIFYQLAQDNIYT